MMTDKRGSIKSGKAGFADNGDAHNKRVLGDGVYDLNSQYFNADMYLSKLIKENSLTEMMDKESEIYKQIQALDNDMQTLVYENYNKFISATDTVRKMKTDFKQMECEMDKLAVKMEDIVKFSSGVNNSLQSKRTEITRLTSTQSLLQKLQFLFELPAQLKKCIEEENYAQAVRYYTKAQKVLVQYDAMVSLKGIQDDCEVIVVELKQKLRNQLQSKRATARQLTECVDLLLQLNEPAESLCDEYLDNARQKLDLDLADLEKQIKIVSGEFKDLKVAEMEHPAEAYTYVPMDILEFVDLGCNGFISNICLVIVSYNDMFLASYSTSDSIGSIATKKLVNFVMNLMQRYFEFVEKRVQLSTEVNNDSVLVRALDKFHRRLQAMNKVLPDTDFARFGVDIVSRAAKVRTEHHLVHLQQCFIDCLTDIRKKLAGPTLEEPRNQWISLLLTTAEANMLAHVKSSVNNLKAFLQPDITFALKPHFREQFCKKFVRDGVIVGFVRHVNTTAMVLYDNSCDKNVVPPQLFVILSRFCYDFHSSVIEHMLNFTDDLLQADHDRRSKHHHPAQYTPASMLILETKDVAQKLLNHYVRVQGLNVSQMIRKSVETRDWLNTIEPRTVRAVMKRVVEELTATEMQVGQLFEEGSRKDRSSDSSRRTFPYSRPHQGVRSWSAYGGTSSLDSSLLSNIQKLFSERIEIFSSVEFNKVSVLTGIIKICLKTFLECVRQRTLSKFGLQQIQVDIHYLQLYLWRFVADENLVHVLLDEILSSAVHRCLDPVLMEPSIVEMICERG